MRLCGRILASLLLFKVSFLPVMVQVKSDFLEMLSEEHSLTPQTQWKKVKGLFHHDIRYRGVETSAQREDWFNDYVKSLGRVRQWAYGGHS